MGVFDSIAKRVHMISQIQFWYLSCMCSMFSIFMDSMYPYLFLQTFLVTIHFLLVSIVQLNKLQLFRPQHFCVKHCFDARQLGLWSDPVIEVMRLLVDRFPVSGWKVSTHPPTAFPLCSCSARPFQFRFFSELQTSPRWWIRKDTCSCLQSRRYSVAQSLSSWPNSVRRSLSERRRARALEQLLVALSLAQDKCTHGEEGVWQSGTHDPEKGAVYIGKRLKSNFLMCQCQF